MIQKLSIDAIEIALHPQIRCLKTLKNALISMLTRFEHIDSSLSQDVFAQQVSALNSSNWFADYSPMQRNLRAAKYDASKSSSLKLPTKCSKAKAEFSRHLVTVLNKTSPQQHLSWKNIALITLNISPRWTINWFKRLVLESQMRQSRTGLTNTSKSTDKMKKRLIRSWSVTL